MHASESVSDNPAEVKGKTSDHVTLTIQDRLVDQFSDPCYLVHTMLMEEHEKRGRPGLIHHVRMM